MFKNYLVVAARQLVKNAHYTVINIVGLAVVLACCIVAYLNYSFSLGFDAFHENADQIYRINSTKIVGDNVQQWGVTPVPLGPTLKADAPFVEDYVRISRSGVVFQLGERVLNETVTFADPGFFDLFTFPLKYGTPDVLHDPNKIVLSEEMAVKYFGDENPLDQQVTLRFNDEEHAFVVGAVTEEIPLNSSIQFGILTTYDNLRIVADVDLDDWGRWGLVTFIKVSDPARLADLPTHFPPYLERQNLARPDWLIDDFYFVPLPEMFLTAQVTRAHILTGNINPASIYAPAILAALLLLMACFNFMNTAIAFADRRLKEIGIRKVVGGVRRQLIGQFMGESMLLCVLAFGLSLLLAEVFVPAYSSLWPYLDLELTYADNLPLLVFLGALLLTTGVIAGAYPAIYISSFNTVSILKGRHLLRGTNAFTRSLLTFQLSISVLVIIASFVFTRNAEYQDTFDMGYDREMLVMVPLGESERFAPYRDALEQQPEILRVAGSRNHIGRSSFTRVVKTDPTAQREAQEDEVELYLIGEDYLETMGLDIAEGRAFDPDRETDYTEAILVNETFVRTFALDEPLGHRVTMDSTRYEIVGVLQDFYEDLWNPIDPSVLRLTKPEQYSFLTARVPSESLAETNALLQAAWREVVPEAPYEGMFQDEVMAQAVLINSSIQTTFFYIALIAIVLSAAGLFALVSLNIARRTKEIGIRKVLGASVLSIGHLINREFILMLLIASVIASLLGYFAISALLDMIWAYHVGMGLAPFLLSTLLIFAIALVTVGGRVYKIATANPINALRYE